MNSLNFVLEFDLVADGELQVGGRVLLGDLNDLVPNVLRVLQELVVVVDVVVGND